jgi:uncharacterized repeat protein (TIGR01451 family)
MARHYRHPPTWFRYGVVALAVIVLCSCRANGPQYRVAGSSDSAAAAVDVSAVRFQSPSDQDASTQVQPASAALPEAPLLAEPFRYYDQSGAAPPGCYNADGAPGCYDGCAICAPGAIRGPSDEYLCDGGDFGTEAVVITGGNVVGLEPEDAIAHYDTIDGRTVVTPSNKVCIYAPRFAAVRHVVDLRAVANIDAVEGAIQRMLPVKIDERDRAATSLAALEPSIHRVKDPPSLLRGRDQAGELDRDRRVAVTLGSVAPYANLQTIRTGEVVGEDIVRLARASLAAITWSGDQAAQVVLDSKKAQAEVSEQTPGTIYLLVEPNNPKLRLIKLASTSAAHPGDEVEFTLRFDNVGDRVIGNVTILDSLTTRLEYVEGSEKCSEEAQFDSRPNEGDALKLRWSLTAPLEPGHGGVIQFRCRVR